MANILVERNSLSDIADSIRAKNGTQTTYKPSEMAAAIDALPSGGITPTGTISITQNGTIDVTQYANASVNVPTGGSTLGTKTITENGTYTASDDSLDGYSSVTVNISGGTGTDIVSIIKGLGEGAFQDLELPTSMIFPAVTNIGKRCFSGTTGMTTLVLPALTSIGQYAFADNKVMQTLDLGTGTPNFSLGWLFSGSTLFDTLILRKTSVISLTNVNVFNATPFASGGSGGTIYVPSSLISSYPSASVWSTLDGYGTVTWAAIEGSQYENYYADGTAISL